MQGLLGISRAIDALNTRVGRAVFWLILVFTLISAGNALMRYAFDISSNAWLEIQWYLFSAVFLLCAPYTLLNNDMVRIDVVQSRFTDRTRAWIEVFGTIFFLMPFVLIVMWLAWPAFLQSYVRGEMSANSGGLIIWPARLLLPVGFALLALQGVSQVIKLLGWLQGVAPNPLDRGEAKSSEELLAEEIARQRGDAA